MRSLVGSLAVVLLATAATYAKGVDVSHYNGTVDWPQVVGASYQFAFAKATEGTTLTDLTYPVNRAGAASMGLRVGAYHFARPAGSGDGGIVANAVAQADFFVDYAQPKSGDLPPVLDLESRGSLSAAGLQTWTVAWLGEVAARTGVAGLVYSSPNFWKTSLGDTQSFATAGNRLWVAHWTSKAAPLVPAANWAGQGWTFWQWTDCSKVPGFVHCSDGDRYHGADPAAVAIPPFPRGAPSSSTPPTVVGTAVAGKTLAAVPGTWAGGKPVSFSYQWQRCDAAGQHCSPIAGALSESYLPGTADVGHALTVAVTASTPSGLAAASSPVTAAVAASASAGVRPAVISPPSISGTLQAGQALTASVGAWTGSPTGFSFQWQRCASNGAGCAAIVGATSSAYMLTPGEIGATVGLVVTATGKGGAASAQVPPTAQVTPAPVPAAVPGSATASAGLAGAVSAPDGSATLTWQPGAVPVGSVVSVARAGRGLLLGVSPTVAQLPWPVDLAYTAPTNDIVGYSADGRIWTAAAKLGSPVLPADELAGTYVDAAGATHVLLRAPGRVALFVPGAWGDPTRVAAGLPTPRLAGAIHTVRRGAVLLVTTRVRLPSQAHLWVSVQGPAHQSLVLKPGIVPVRIRVSARRIAHGARLRLRVAARDPWGRSDTLLATFRAP